MSGLPTPPVEDRHRSLQVRKTSKQTKPLNRTSKRSASSQEHGAVVVDGRHKRVWKACERCRMKKTKCDGESPCKRCKDDGLVCTAGSRKKTEFKQLPRGYAEVLENTQYALIATVQKLYSMIRNNETWDLGEPEMNDRGQPVIHDIASKLGCIRHSPDLPYAFPEGAEDFAELQAKLQAARSDLGAEDAANRKQSESSHSSPSLTRTERASSTESNHSLPSEDSNQMLWAQQDRQTATKKPTPLKIVQRNSLDDESAYSARASFDTTGSMPSPVYTDFPSAQSPMFRKASPFPPWAAGDGFLGQPHALDLTAQYMRGQQQPALAGVPGSSPLDGSASMGLGLEPDVLKAMQISDGMNFADGTIRPNMLDCSTGGYDLNDQLDNIIFGNEYESQMGRA